MRDGQDEVFLSGSGRESIGRANWLKLGPQNERM